MAESDKQKKAILPLFYNSVIRKKINNKLYYLIPMMMYRQSAIEIDKKLVNNKLQKLNVGKSCGPDNIPHSLSGNMPQSSVNH